jgi:hypothetical protein
MKEFSKSGDAMVCIVAGVIGLYHLVIVGDVEASFMCLVICLFFRLFRGLSEVEDKIS